MSILAIASLKMTSPRLRDERENRPKKEAETSQRHGVYAIANRDISRQNMSGDVVTPTVSQVALVLRCRQLRMPQLLWLAVRHKALPSHGRVAGCAKQYREAERPLRNTRESPLRWSELMTKILRQSQVREFQIYYTRGVSSTPGPVVFIVEEKPNRSSGA